MQLEPRQLSTLSEMGIPVWELRKPLSSSTAVALTEQQINSDWLLIHDDENHTEQKQQLLTAMLASINIDINTAALIAHDQFQALISQPLEKKMLLVFGQRFLSQLLPEQENAKESSSEVYELSGSELRVIVTHDLSDLIQQPDKKRNTWTALKLAQRTFLRFN